MSSTNRGAERIEQDFYPTPLKSFDPLIPYLLELPPIKLNKIKNALIVWEPACGDSRLIHAMKARGIPADGNDLNNGYDFLQDKSRRDVILTNPPFSLAKEFIEHAVNHSNHVFMLIRIGLFGSEERREWWKQHKPKAIFILSKRPNFVISAKCGNIKDGTKCSDPFNRLFQIEEKNNIPKICPCCGGKIKKGSSDSSEYVWAYFGDHEYEPFNWI